MHTATHPLERFSWQHISKSNEDQKAHSNLPTESDLMAACQQIHVEPWSHTSTHILEEILWQHVSKFN